MGRDGKVNDLDGKSLQIEASPHHYFILDHPLHPKSLPFPGGKLSRARTQHIVRVGCTHAFLRSHLSWAQMAAPKGKRGLKAMQVELAAAKERWGREIKLGTAPKGSPGFPWPVTGESNPCLGGQNVPKLWSRLYCLV